MATPSVAVIDALNSLLEAEANSIFHFVGEGSPYLSTATLEARKILEGMRRHLDQHEQDLTDLIRRLGGKPSIPPKPDPNDQYLSFLSLKFLIPKLVEAKELMIERYDHAMRSVEGDEGIKATLEKHMVEMRTDLAVLKKLAAEVGGRG